MGWTMLGTRFTAPKAAKEGYWSYLEPRLNDADYRRACEHLFATCTRFPRPADFIEELPLPQGEGWDDYRTWPCEECGEVGRSIGPPEFRICTACVRFIGRKRLRELGQRGDAVTVGYGLLREQRRGIRLA